MRNKDKWQPTKIALTPSGAIQVPGARGELAPGSTLIATLVARWYSEVVPKYAHGSLLDLGCGKVPLYQLYSRCSEIVFCTDWPASLHGTTFLDFASDLADGISLRDGSIDTLIASDVLEHIFRPDALMQEMHRVLKHQGVVLLNTPFMYWIHEAPHDYYRYTPFALERMARDAGLTVERLDVVGGPILVVADVCGKLIQRVPIVGRSLAIFLQKLTLRLAVRLPTSPRFPLLIGAVLVKR